MNKSKFQVGDLVTALPGAWSRIISRPDIQDCHLQTSMHRIYQVVAVKAAIPVNGTLTANTLIVSQDTGDLIAVNDCNLTSVQATIIIRFFVNGQDITNGLSEHSKQEIYRANIK